MEFVRSFFHDRGTQGYKILTLAAKSAARMGYPIQIGFRRWRAMRDVGRRPLGRLFYWALIFMMMASGLLGSAFGIAPASAAPTTTIADTVYMADGTPAAGTLIITWPAFVTSNGTAVAGGSTSVSLAANGALNVGLVPNAGATPAGVYYTVVYQLGASQVKTEYWVVPTNSPVNLATVRTTPGTGLAAQPVSVQYVNSALAAKADDSAVVHLNGQETISGTKTFAAAPNVPAPTGTAQVANKAYVDQSVATVGAGNYLSTAGGTMSGPITLPGSGIEGMCANKSGAEKKDAAMSFLQNALAMSDAIASREIVQPEEFKNGISQIIDGVVLCMNSSSWAKGSTQTTASIVGNP